MKCRLYNFAAWVVCCCVVVAGFAGCETANQRPAVEPDISLRGIPIDRMPQPPSGLDDPAALPRSQTVTSEIRWLELPLELTLQEAWAEVDETVLPEVSRLVWNANGLRVGVLQRSNRGAFIDKIREVKSARRAMHQGGTFPSPIRASPKLNADFFIDLTRPGTEARMVTVNRGKFQLLAAFEPVGGGSRVALTPHHYKREVSLYPRNPLRKALDGRIYDELGVDLVVDTNSILVIGLHRPPNIPEEDEKTIEDEDSVKTGTQFFGSWIDPPPLHLGRGLFTTEKDTQLLYMLNVLP